MKKFLALFLVFFSVGAAYVVGDYLGAKAQKDADSLHAADLSKALGKSVAQFNACESSDITPVISQATGTITLSAIQTPKPHHRKPALCKGCEAGQSFPFTSNWIAPEHPFEYYCGSHDCSLNPLNTNNCIVKTGSGDFNTCANWVKPL